MSGIISKLADYFLVLFRAEWGPKRNILNIRITYLSLLSEIISFFLKKIDTNEIHSNNTQHL